MKIKLLAKSTAVLLFLIINGGCNKMELAENCNCKITEGKSCLVYNSTNCNDAWGYEDSREKTGKNIKKYFSSKGIHLYSIGFDEQANGVNCSSCSCLSGVQICAQVNEEDVLEMIQEGFYTY